MVIINGKIFPIEGNDIGSANVVGGQFVFLKTQGRCVDKMIVKQPAAMKAITINAAKICRVDNRVGR